MTVVANAPTLTERSRALREKPDMRRLTSLCVHGLLVVTLLIPAGCSLSTSSRSASDSSDSVESSSRSSTSGKKDSRYREDVRSYAAAYLESGGRFEAFEKKLGELARRHGVTNWEDDQATYVGFGEGLGDARVDQGRLDAYKTELSRLDPLKMQAIQQGYDARR